EFPGFRDALASLLEEFSAAGADGGLLATLQAQGSFKGHFAGPLTAIFSELEAELERRGLFLRTTWMRRVCAAIDIRGLPAIHRLYLDGFLSFSSPELEALAALARHSELTITLPDWPGAGHARSSLRALGLKESPLPARASTARLVLVAPPTLEQ